MNNGTERTAFIVDGAYANLGSRSQSITLDYKRLKKLVERDLAGGRLQESYFINAVSGEMPETMQRFYRFIQSAEPEGPQMRVELYGHKRIVHECTDCSRKCEKLVQKGVDVAIATRMIEAAIRCNRVILFLGDSDFVESIRFIKSQSEKEVIIIGFKGSVSPEIQSLADRVVWLNDHASQIQRTVA